MLAAGLIALLGVISGCGQSRAAQLRDVAAGIERRLTSERDVTFASMGDKGARSEKISHLTTLRTALSVANVSLVAVPIVLPETGQRDVAYGVLQEVYATIDWNIPIVDQSGQRMLPALFSPGSGLDFAAIQRGQQPGSLAPIPNPNSNRGPGIVN